MTNDFDKTGVDFLNDTLSTTTNKKTVNIQTTKEKEYFKSIEKTKLELQEENERMKRIRETIERNRKEKLSKMTEAERVKFLEDESRTISAIVNKNLKLNG